MRRARSLELSTGSYFNPESQRGFWKTRLRAWWTPTTITFGLILLPSVRASSLRDTAWPTRGSLSTMGECSPRAQAGPLYVLEFVGVPGAKRLAFTLQDLNTRKLLKQQTKIWVY